MHYICTSGIVVVEYYNISSETDPKGDLQVLSSPNVHACIICANLLEIILVYGEETTCHSGGPDRWCKNKKTQSLIAKQALRGWSYLIKAALPLLFTLLQISTLRVTQENEIFSRNDMFTCAYFGNNISFFKYPSLVFFHFPQQALSVLSCFPSIHPLQHVSFTVMFSSSKNLLLLCSQVVFMQRTRLWSKKGDEVNEGSWGEKIQKQRAEWRQSVLMKK